MPKKSSETVSFHMRYYLGASRLSNCGGRFILSLIKEGMLNIYAFNIQVTSFRHQSHLL